MRILDIATTKNYEVEGIVLNKKTVEEVYEKFFKEANIIFNKNEKYENLIISKDKVRVEVIIERDISNVKTEI